MTQQPTMQWSAADIAAAEQTLARTASGEVTHVVTLTDEEVAILDGLQNPQLVPLPWLDAQEGADRTLVGRVALRSLLARGLVVPSDEERPPGPGGEPQVGIDAVPEVTGPLVLRRTASAILSADRTTALGKHWVYVYLHDEDRVLEEEVGPSGHHSFSVYPLTELAGRLAVFLDPAAKAVLDGRARTFTTEQFAAEARTSPELSGAVAVTVLGAVRAGSDTLVRVSVYATPDGVYVVRGGEHGADGAPVTLELSEVGPATLRRLPAELLGRCRPRRPAPARRARCATGPTRRASAASGTSRPRRRTAPRGPWSSCSCCSRRSPAWPTARSSPRASCSWPSPPCSASCCGSSARRSCSCSTAASSWAPSRRSCAPR